jgi:hypothetical protein
VSGLSGRFVGLGKVIDVDDLRGRDSNSANHFVFWGLLRLIVPNRLALRRVDGFGSKDVTTRFWVSGETNGGFTRWRVSSRGWCIINDYGRSAVSTNNGSDSSLCGRGAFVGITGVLENMIRPKTFANLHETHISGELITRSDKEVRVRTTFGAEEAWDLPREVPSFQPLRPSALVTCPLVSICEWTEVPEVPDRDNHEDGTDL